MYDCMYIVQTQQNGTAKRWAEIWAPEAWPSVTSQGESKTFAIFYDIT